MVFIGGKLNDEDISFDEIMKNESGKILETPVSLSDLLQENEETDRNAEFNVIRNTVKKKKMIDRYQE